MKIKDLKVGDIFRVPSMRQWGIMMKSYHRDDKKIIFVSLSGNRWAHNEYLHDSDIECVLLNGISEVIRQIV